MSNNEIKLYEIDFYSEFTHQNLPTAAKELNMPALTYESYNKYLNAETVRYLTNQHFSTTIKKKLTKQQQVGELSEKLKIPLLVADLLHRQNAQIFKSTSTKERVKDLVITTLENDLQDIDYRIKECYENREFTDLMTMKNKILDSLAKAVNLNEKIQTTNVINGDLTNNNNSVNNTVNLSKQEEFAAVEMLFKALIPPKPLYIQSEND